MRHMLGLLGLLAASGLVLVSAAMNWRFGFSLGKTEFDGHVYGLASVAADCLKAIIPFLVIYALRTRHWVQALAGIALGVICTGYSLTSSLGFAALNRADNQGERMIKVTNYNDTRAELKRLEEKIAWMPKHRPYSAVEADLASANARQVKMRGRDRATVAAITGNCTRTNWVSRKYCPQIFNLKKELAIAEEARRIETRIVTLKNKVSGASNIAATGKTDPQADFLSNLFGLKLEVMQTVLILLVSLLVEAGSALGYFVVFSMWRADDSLLAGNHMASNKRAQNAKSATRDRKLLRKELVQDKDGSQEQDHLMSDNDNDVVTASHEEEERSSVLLPKNELELFFDDRIEYAEGSSTTATDLYEDYCDWCEREGSNPMALTPFGRQFSKFSIKKAKIAGRIRYIGIRLKAKQAGDADTRVA